jgi:hypothetical protein
LLSVNVGMPKDVAWQGNTVHTGVFKSPVAGRRRVGRLNAIVDTFAPDGYYREPIGPHRTHRGADELRSFFTRRFSVGGGIGLTPCVVTDDRVRCAVEYNCTRWGRQDLPAQAGVAIYERGPDGLLAAARVYDDIELPDGAPVTRPYAY